MKTKSTKVGKSQPSKINWTEVLGPVENLESYVRADWWRNLFNANYLRTDGDVVDDEQITKDELDTFLAILNPPKDAAILDLCCGQGRFTFELWRRGLTNVVGLDRSHYLITKARTMNRRFGGTITFKEGDARNLQFPPDTFDYVLLAGNSFGYFESLQDDLKVLMEIKRVLRPNGTLLIEVTDGDYMRANFQARSWEWIDKKFFVCRERSLSQNGERLISREVITHVQKGVVADQFYAERLYTADSLTEIFKRAAFADIKLHTEIVGESQRNQDLGMMAKRIAVTAAAQKDWAPVRKKKTDKKKSVMVIMGDPRNADVVKPNASFDDDDFFTIDELKKALAELPDYQFTYLDNHATLITELQRLRGELDFVFNLCDEGFNNDPTKELHVPSMLEMLDIPYTGGNPQCLAFCYDKSLVRGIAKEMDIPVPRAFFIKAEDVTFIELPLDFPVIVKPNFGDSSFGITQNNVCYDIQALEDAILSVRDKIGYTKPVLVEEFLRGKDLSVGIIGNPPESYSALPIVEEDYSSLPPGLPWICGYEVKWIPDSPYAAVTSIPANLSEDLERFLIASCSRLFERLECRDYARFDWRQDANGTPRLLEVNPNPGWCWDGHLAKMAKIGDMSYSRMLGAILKAAEKRVRRTGRVEKEAVVRN